MQNTNSIMYLCVTLAAIANSDVRDCDLNKYLDFYANI